MSTFKVLAGNPCSKVPVCNEFYDCFFGLTLPEGSYFRRVVGGDIPANLNKLVEEAIEKEMTHIFIVEDDSVFDKDTVMRLLAHDKPVVTGHCRARHFPYRSYIYRGMNEDGLLWYTLKPEDSGLIKCDATGMGGILINLDVFKNMERPFFSHTYVDEKYWGQDIVFGMRLVEMGVDVYCDLDVMIGHVTQCVIGSDRGPEGWNVVLRVSEAQIKLPQPGL